MKVGVGTGDGMAGGGVAGGKTGTGVADGVDGAKTGRRVGVGMVFDVLGTVFGPVFWVVLGSEVCVLGFKVGVFGSRRTSCKFESGVGVVSSQLLRLTIAIWNYNHNFS